MLSGVARAEDSPFARPPELERDVRFWIRIYTEVTTDGGLLHDDWNLGLVYEALRFDPTESPLARERRVAQAKARYAALLRRFADGDSEHLTAHERRILHAFGEHPMPHDFLDAVDRIRFQLGQADRFHEGLIRAEGWERQIARVFEQHGVPAEIAALPHVESSFNPAAYSKVGAAGLWQFMPSTAKRFMRVDGIVDQRLDPYAATAAAANLMLYNYHLLGSWPLAVTAYNHGPAGLKRAQEQLGTSDIAVIVKHYQGATFGFASRNFYVAFLAALEVDRNAEKYFGSLTRLPDTESTVVEVPDYVPIEALARAFKIDPQALRVLNPALRPPVWAGTRWVPRGYALRIPDSPPELEISAAWARLSPAQRYLAQRNDGRHKVRRGETLAGIAAASGMSLARLAAANGWSVERAVARGETVRVPLPPSRAEIAAGETNAPPPAVVAAAAEPVVPATTSADATPTEPVSQRQAASVALLPAGTPTSNPDTTEYGVLGDDTVIVQADETLGHFATWCGVDAERLRRLNHTDRHAHVALGHHLKLDFSRVPAADFVAARRAYHLKLQESFFAEHRIAGTQSYAVKRGESLWMIAERSNVPLWLVAQYNPDTDIGELKPGTSITLPRVEPINRQ